MTRRPELSSFSRRGLRWARLAAAGVLLLSALGSAPAWAQNVQPLATVCDTAARSCSWNYGGTSGWGGVVNQDARCDGYGTYANYERDTGGIQRLDNNSGCNSTIETGTSSNLIKRFRACTKVNLFPDFCSSYVWR